VEYDVQEHGEGERPGVHCDRNYGCDELTLRAVLPHHQLVYLFSHYGSLQLLDRRQQM